ncbi:MAG: magnesium transporter [Dehalococcoidia bacterium]|nr:magnesium transporter [Dehalococcoidia bacterium]
MPEEPSARDLIDEARGHIAGGDWPRTIAVVAQLHPADLADLVLQVDDDERRALIAQLPTDVVGQLFEYAEDKEEIRELIRAVGREDLAAVLEEVPDDVAADVIQQLEPEEREETLAALDRGEEVAELLQYRDDSAGALMTRGFVALNESLTVRQATEYLRLLQPPSERAYYLYVTDDERRLQGTVSLRDLIVSADDTTLREITLHDVHAVTTQTDQEEAARTLQRYNLLAVPVVDAEGRLEGVMTADDLIDVLQEEATEDMYRMAGVGDDERVFSPVRTSVRRRLPWMLVNTLTAFVGALTVAAFDGTLAKVTVLAFFMPVVAGQGGNAGTQTATIAVRSIALGDLDVSDILRACRKEIQVAIASGVAVGLLAGAMSYAWKHNEALSLVLGAALLLNILAATLAGVLIPLTLKSLRIDPALAANIFVTTITDVLGFLFFLGLAALAIDQIA